MKQLRYLTTADLYKVTYTKQANGQEVETYTKQSTYNVQVEQLRDSVSASLYGARIINMLRMSSVRNDLEKTLENYMIENNDNISMYRIEYGGVKYKINSVGKAFIEIEKV